MDMPRPTKPSEAKEPTSNMNSVVWFNVPSDDLERATTFYRNVFGWRIQPLSVEREELLNYHTALTGKSDENLMPVSPGVVNGCIVKRKMGIPHATILIEVDDLDEAAERVKAAGGEVVSQKIRIENVRGTLILVKDTEGNIVEVMKQDNDSRR